MATTTTTTTTTDDTATDPTANIQDPTVIATETDATNTNTAALDKSNISRKTQSDLLQQVTVYMQGLTDNTTIASALKFMSEVGNKAGGAMQFFADKVGLSEELNKQSTLTTGQTMKLGLAFQALGAVGDPSKLLANPKNLNAFTISLKVCWKQ